MDVYGYYAVDDGYMVTKNGEDYIHTSNLIEAAKIVELLLADERCE